MGKHCSLPHCKMQDFLPFKCDCCGKSYCLDHRTYAAHGCKGNDNKDVTSIDCPICHKSIKFFKSEVADVAWDKHFRTDCTQTAAGPSTAPKAPTRCGMTSCRVVLTTSNKFQCPKCRVEVCLAHRIPEEHSCRALTQNRPKPAPLQSNAVVKPAANAQRISPPAPPAIIKAPTTAATAANHTSSTNRPAPPNDGFLSKIEARNNNPKNKKVAPPQRTATTTASNVSGQGSVKNSADSNMARHVPATEEQRKRVLAGSPSPEAILRCPAARYAFIDVRIFINSLVTVGFMYKLMISLCFKNG